MSESRQESTGSSVRRCGLATALAVVALVMSSPASAGDASPGMRVFKDPISGELRAPTAEEAAALEGAGSAKGLRRTPRGLLTGKVNPPSVTYPDGTIGQELDESSLAYTVMTRNADGTTSMVCVTGAEAADAALKGRKSAKTAKQSKEHTHDVK